MSNDNLDGKFKAYDSSRRNDALAEHKLSEVKAKLIYSTERQLWSHLSAIPGAKILSTKIDNLEITEDVESGAPIFTGKVTTSVSFIEGKNERVATIPVNIAESQPALVAADIENAIENAPLVTEAATFTPTNVVTASLSDFKVVDDGTRYLKVYHTAAYGDLEAIGAVSKDEYVTAADKGALLSEMFSDEAVSWPADVNFTGTFAEPEIITASVPADTQYVVHATPEVANEEIVAEATDWKYKVADAGRFRIEAEQKNFDDLSARITQRAVSAFNDAWKSRGTGTCHIRNTKSTWNKDSNTGDIIIEAEVLDGKDTKLVPFTIGVNGATMHLPDFVNLSAMLKEAKIVDHSIQGENISRNIELAKTAAVEKKATPSAPQQQQNQDMLRMPKDFLPKTLKVGDIIEVDGLFYKLTSKSEGQLSSQKDSASYWLFERVPRGDDKSSYKQQSY